MKRILQALVVLAIVSGASWLGLSSRSPSEDVKVAERRETPTAASAFVSRESNVWVEDRGTVVAVLPDDTEGSRHQRFLIRIGNDSTLLVVHNIDLAPRVPIEKGDEVQVRGEYVWNEKGGLVHWTHHDPDGRLDGGFVRHDGQDYR